jgi:cytochrome b
MARVAFAVAVVFCLWFVLACTGATGQMPKKDAFKGAFKMPDGPQQNAK